MIRTLKVDNLLGHSRIFALGDVNDGIVCTDIQGLGPVQMDLDMAKASAGGAHFLGGHVGTRNIVAYFTVSRTKNKSIEQVREAFYQIIDVGREVALTIESDNKIGSTTGVIESVEPDIFARVPTLQVSIMAQPYFVDEKVGRQTVQIPNDESWGYVTYDGTVMTGVTIEIMSVLDYYHLPSRIYLHESISGVNQNEQKLLHLPERDMSSGTGQTIKWKPGDRLILVTTPGKKSARFRYHAQTTEYDVMEGIRGYSEFEYPKSSDWFELKPFATRHGFKLTTDERLPTYALDATVSWDTMFRGF